MNLAIVCGRICSIPKSTVIMIDGAQCFVCKFTIALENGEYCTSGKMVDKSYDFLETITFGSPAEHISKHFSNGSKIVTYGTLKNYKFNDANGTAHYTNILVINHVEFGDSQSAITNVLTKKSNADVTIKADLKHMEDMFKRACEDGFFCIDENDYYRIATGRMEI